MTHTNLKSYDIFYTELFVYIVYVFVYWAEIYTRLSMQKKEGVGSDHSDTIHLSKLFSSWKLIF